MVEIVAVAGFAEVPQSGRQNFILLTHRFSGDNSGREVVELCAPAGDSQREAIFAAAPPRIDAPLERWTEWAQHEAESRGLHSVYLCELTRAPARLAA